LVKWGEGTNDEMCIGIFEWIPVDADDASANNKSDAHRAE
jgi:hypothetical protein